MAKVFLGLGSNVGNRALNIKKALRSLKQNKINVIKLSTIIETDPVGGPKGQGKFLNAVLKADTALAPEDLLKTLKTIEDKLGRIRTVRNGPRTIDIDILLYNRKRVKINNLTIPHPRMFTRDFVMTPLKEIAPRIAKELTYADHKKR